MDDSPLIIETCGLTKRFGSRTAVAGLDLAVPRGCAFGFLGHNGAGKTTLFRMLAGLIKPDAGTIWIGGRLVAGNRQDVMARVGAIIEEPRFHGQLTGEENLRVVAAARGPAARALIGPALVRTGLAGRAGHRVRTYSQGMRQRLGIARCLLADPALLILDEPMNGLDPGGILDLRTMIAGLVAEGRTVFLSSHLLGEIEKTCHAAAVIDGGRLIAQGPIGELTGQGRTEFDVGCGRPGAAVGLLTGHPAVAQVRETADGVRVTLAAPAGRSAARDSTAGDSAAGGGAAGGGAISALLIEAGITVFRFAPVRASLEDRFLQLTSRGQDQS